MGNILSWPASIESVRRKHMLMSVFREAEEGRVKIGRPRAHFGD